LLVTIDSYWGSSIKEAKELKAVIREGLLLGLKDPSDKVAENMFNGFSDGYSRIDFTEDELQDLLKRVPHEKSKATILSMIIGVQKKNKKDFHLLIRKALDTDRIPFQKVGFHHLYRYYLIQNLHKKSVPAGALSEKELINYIQKGISSENTFIQGMALLISKYSKSNQSLVRIIEEFLPSLDPGNRHMAAQTLVFASQKKAALQTKALINKYPDDNMVCQGAINGLAHAAAEKDITRKELEDYCFDLINQPESKQRKFGIDGISRFLSTLWNGKHSVSPVDNSWTCVKRLMELANDPDEGIANEAIRSLGHANPTNELTSFLKKLKSKNPRNYAPRSALSRIRSNKENLKKEKPVNPDQVF